MDTVECFYKIYTEYSFDTLNNDNYEGKYNICEVLCEICNFLDMMNDYIRK
jgi:hypothetical protein